MHMKRALVCGAGGFIGSHPFDKLRAGPSTSSGQALRLRSGQVFEVTKSFPKEETYSLMDQIQRS